MNEIVKKCFNCGVPVTDDHTNRKRPECRKCEIPREAAKAEKRKKRRQEHREENKERILKKEAEHREKNREKIREQSQKHRDNISEERKKELKEYHRKHYEENIDEIKKQSQEYYQENKEEIAKKHAEWWAAHPGYQLEREREFYKDPKNREKKNRRARQWMKKNRKRVGKRSWELRKARMRKDIQYKISTHFRGSFSRSIRKGYKSASVLKLIGCSLEDFKKYIESKFTPGMTWENWGIGRDKWHMDHIIPTSSFDLTKKEEQERCWHYSNFQPLWQDDNLKKQDTLPCGRLARDVGKVGMQYVKEIL